MGFFKKMFLLQLVELVLTYNFSNCDFEKIQKDYENIIFPNLYDYMNKTESEELNHVACYNSSDCLTKIERHTFSSTVCPSLSRERFALTTKATFARHCPGYFKIQINRTQKKQQKVIRNCWEQTSQIKGWWDFFNRHLGK
ncbi:thymic stromal lymphopoietin [Cavia porcellus]|uniref:thymic stromal lymphopoietin n=1 Tax=Cavia porcellus TaxID=10141 RepID=UPI002FDFC86B